MTYEPKVLYNPKEETVEFMCNRQSYKFLPGEKRNLDGFVAHHALNFVNTGLREYIPGEDEGVSNIGYDKLRWKDLLIIASKRGVFTPGSKREEVIQALKDLDDNETEKKGSVISDTTSKEEE
jgi:hypothetical protein